MVTGEQSDQPVEVPASKTQHAIINPASGGGRAGKRWPAFARALGEAGIDVQPHFTIGPGDATILARRLATEGAETIVCVGGDGTMNEIVNGLIADDLPVNPATRLALVPAGTGKDFGRTLGTREIRTCIRALMEGTTVAIDIGRIQFIDIHTRQLTTRYFANVADAGLGAAVAERINASSKVFGGFVSYCSGAIRAIGAFEPWSVTVETDGQLVYSGEAGLVAFANGRYFGGGMYIAPEASLCDGELDMFVLEGVRRRVLLTSLLPRVYRGAHVNRPGVRHLRISRAVVKSASPMLIEMDGEQVGRTPMMVDVLPGALRVVGLREALARVGGCTDRGS